MSSKSTGPAGDRSRPSPRWQVVALALLLAAGQNTSASFAYTAAGDRTFPATLVLPQVAPSDAVWATFGTLPMDAGENMPMDVGENKGTTRESSFTGTFSKTITDRLGIQFEDGVKLHDRLNGSTIAGFPNLEMTVQYEMLLDQLHEFVLSAGVDREFGRTGDQRINVKQQSATQPSFYFAKGWNELPLDYLRPLAITGFAGYQFAEQGGRANMVNAGFSVQYSMPYLLSKVAAVDLPPFLRGMTPLVEVLYSVPAGHTEHQPHTLLVAPGVSFSQGNGWEVAIEAEIPTNRATGHGLGVIAQVVIQLDYLLPNSILGRPIFSP